MADFDDMAQTMIQALLNGGAPNGHTPAEFGPWVNEIDALYDAHRQGGTPGVRRAFDALAHNNIRLAVLLADKLAPPSPGDAPPLPFGAQPDPAIGAGAGKWIDDYVSYASKVSPMTPAPFHVSAALWLGSVAIARRLKLAMDFGDVYPNLFIIWLAPTTLWRKTTGLDIARKLARDVFSHLLATQDMTPEGFLSDLAGREPAQFDALTEAQQAAWRSERNYAAQRGLLLDEMSGLMAAAGKDYNAGLVEAFLRFYDCDPLYTRSTRGQGRIVVSNSYLTMLSASTPAAMAPHMGSERLWSMGWWPRFAILTPDTERPTWCMSEKASNPPTKTLTQLYTQLPQATWPAPPEARGAVLGTGVFEAWERYDKAVSYDLLTPDLDGKLWGTYGRLPVQALKVALILAAVSWTDKTEKTDVPIVELPHLARAIAIVETWRASAHRAISGALTTDFDRLAQRVLRQITLHDPAGATMRDMYRGMRDKEPYDIETVVQQLLNIGEIEEVKPEEKKAGRPAIRYRITRDR